jgi:hypothetical protein
MKTKYRYCRIKLLNVGEVEVKKHGDCTVIRRPTETGFLTASLRVISRLNRLIAKGYLIRDFRIIDPDTHECTISMRREIPTDKPK